MEPLVFHHLRGRRRYIYRPDVHHNGSGLSTRDIRFGKSFVGHVPIKGAYRGALVSIGMVDLATSFAE
jgi:hypothetical protein